MLNSNLCIETERVLIRPFKIEVIKLSYQINLEAEVSKYTGNGS